MLSQVPLGGEDIVAEAEKYRGRLGVALVTAIIELKPDGLVSSSAWLSWGLYVNCRLSVPNTVTATFMVIEPFKEEDVGVTVILAL